MTVICPVRRTPVFSLKSTRITPPLPPVAPSVIWSQSEPAEMLAE